MIYARVDVKLRDHERAHRAGVAMATWTWALLYAREQESDGFVPDVALRGAWVGEKQARRDAEILVEVGLWEQADRGYRICRYEAKNETKESIAARRKETRERVANHRRASVGTNADVTRYEGVTNADVSEQSSTLVPGSRSGSGSEGGAGGKRALRPDEPLTEQRRKDFAALTLMTRPRDIAADWACFVDDRIKRSALFAGDAAIDADWRNWIRRGSAFAAKEEPKNGGASPRARRDLTGYEP